MFFHPLNTLLFLSLTHTLNSTRAYDHTRMSKSLLSGDERFIGLSLLTDAALLLSFFLSYSSTFKLTYCPFFERQASAKHLFHSEHHR